jgi:hypothetical protein
MAVPIGRTERRIAKEVQVELPRPNAPEPQETATAQNISERGMRVVTEHVWRPGDLVFLTSRSTGFRIQARVVYCQRLENMGFAVGLELSTAIQGLANLY